MTATWDLYAKDLLRERPQDFATLVLPGSRYIGRRESQYQMREVRLDRLIEVEYFGERLLINVEIQAAKDKKMARRLLRYCLEALDEYELPVVSCVIYLQKIGEHPDPPWRLELQSGQRIIWFDYFCIELAEKTTDDLRQLNLLGVLPLFILSKDGQTLNILDEVVTRLEAGRENDLLAITRLMAERIFKTEDDQAWLTRRFTMLRDIEETPTYQRLIKKGMEQGREEGREEGKFLEIRQDVEMIVSKRFPDLHVFVKALAEQLTDLEKLRELLLEVSTASTAKELKQYLLDL